MLLTDVAVRELSINKEKENFQNTDSPGNPRARVLALKELQRSLEPFPVPASLTSVLLSLSPGQLLLFHVLILARRWDN